MSEKRHIAPRGRKWRRLGWACVLVLFAGAGLAPAGQAQGRPSLEYQVKASYLFNFLQFVRWPEAVLASRTEAQVCVLGEDRFGVALDAIDGEVVGGRPVRVRRVESIAEADACLVLFVTESQRRQQRRLLEALAARPILTVGESRDFAEDGGMINLIEQGGKIRFEVNRAAANQAGLSMSAQLLSLAVRIIEEPEGD